MANFWDRFLNSDLQKPDDPGDPSMPYGPPLWPQTEQRPADMRSSDPSTDEKGRAYLQEFFSRLGADTYRTQEAAELREIAQYLSGPSDPGIWNSASQNSESSPALILVGGKSSPPTGIPSGGRPVPPSGIPNLNIMPNLLVSPDGVTRGGAAPRFFLPPPPPRPALPPPPPTLALPALPTPNFIVSPGGTAFPVPDGAMRGSVRTGKGFAYRDGSGGYGFSPDTTGLRLMDPVLPPRRYPYPNGYGVYMDRNDLTIDPFTGRTILDSDDLAHIPF
jgi:hypothetical protein